MLWVTLLFVFVSVTRGLKSYAPGSNCFANSALTLSNALTDTTCLQVTLENNITLSGGLTASRSVQLISTPGRLFSITCTANDQWCFTPSQNGIVVANVAFFAVQYGVLIQTNVAVTFQNCIFGPTTSASDNFIAFVNSGGTAMFYGSTFQGVLQASEGLISCTNCLFQPQQGFGVLISGGDSYFSYCTFDGSQSSTPLTNAGINIQSGDGPTGVVVLEKTTIKNFYIGILAVTDFEVSLSMCKVMENYQAISFTTASQDPINSGLLYISGTQIVSNTAAGVQLTYISANIVDSLISDNIPSILPDSTAGLWVDTSVLLNVTNTLIMNNGNQGNTHTSEEQAFEYLDWVVVNNANGDPVSGKTISQDHLECHQDFQDTDIYCFKTHDYCVQNTPPGYQLVNCDPYSGETYQDINECTSGTASCSRVPNATCTNTDGGYLCACQHGYTGNPGKECTDINESAKGLCTLKHAVCLNFPGNYSCTCPQPLKQVGLACVGCGDGYCNRTAGENCFNCVSDCFCKVPGWKFEYWLQPFASFSTPSNGTIWLQNVFSVTNLLNQIYSAKITGQFFAETSGTYNFLFSAAHNNTVNMVDIAAAIYFDGELMIGGKDFSTSSISYSFEKTCQAGQQVEVLIEFFGAADVVANFTWDSGITANSFQAIQTDYDSSVCGDGSCSPNENSVDCPDDCTVCGDGVCGPSENHRNCRSDCLGEPPMGCTFVLPQSNIQTGLNVGDDTIGDLIYNQFQFSIPGIDHLAHGVNIFTGEEMIAPIFNFTYCTEAQAKVLQDPWRGNMYHVPYQVDADAYPTCSYTTYSSTYTSSSEFANEMVNKASASYSGSAQGGVAGANFEVEGAYSQEKSVQSAATAESQTSGTLIVTEAQCLSSRVQLNSFAAASLHSTFTEALTAAMNQSDQTGAILNLMYKYGTYYYRSADMGGLLRQIISISDSVSSEMNSTAIEQAATASFSASASGYGQGGKAAGEWADNNGQDGEAQQSFMENTAQSTIITYGGAPGSFGPTSDAYDAPTDWSGWAQTIDLLPVPVNYQLERIYYLLEDTTQQAAWAEAEMKYNEQFLSNYLQPDGQEILYKVQIYSSSPYKTSCSSTSYPTLGFYFDDSSYDLSNAFMFRDRFNNYQDFSLPQTTPTSSIFVEQYALYPPFVPKYIWISPGYFVDPANIANILPPDECYETFSKAVVEANVIDMVNSIRYTHVLPSKTDANNYIFYPQLQPTYNIILEGSFTLATYANNVPLTASALQQKDLGVEITIKGTEDSITIYKPISDFVGGSSVGYTVYNPSNYDNQDTPTYYFREILSTWDMPTIGTVQALAMRPSYYDTAGPDQDVLLSFTSLEITQFSNLQQGSVNTVYVPNLVYVPVSAANGDAPFIVFVSGLNDPSPGFQTDLALISSTLFNMPVPSGY